MSHNVETMAWAGEVPWHGLGKEVHPDLTPEQMLVEAGLDWEVYKSPNYTKTREGKEITSSSMSLIRSSDDKILDGKLGKDWEPVQNAEAAEFFKEFIDMGDMQMHTAGSLQKGKIVWFLAKVNDGFTVFGKDDVESHLLFTNHHKYGFATDVRFTPIRVVCNNTLSMALDGKADMQVSVSHRRAFDAEKVKETLGIAHQKIIHYKEAAEFLGSKNYKKDWTKVEDYFNEVFPSMSKKSEEFLSKNAAEAIEIVKNGTQPGAELGRGTWWEVFNTVTYMTDHLIGRNNDSRLTAAWYGLERKRKMTALEKALEYAENS